MVAIVAIFGRLADLMVSSVSNHDSLPPAESSSDSEACIVASGLIRHGSGEKSSVFELLFLLEPDELYKKVFVPFI